MRANTPPGGRRCGTACLGCCRSWPPRPPAPPPRRPPRRFGSTRLRYAERGDSGGHPIILLHGYGDSWFSYSRVLPLFAERYRVYALDLRGHGGSDRPASGYAMRDLAADVLAFMDARRIRRASVVGHSMGSLVAQQVALAAPDRVTRLALIGAGTTARHVPGIAQLQATSRRAPFTGRCRRSSWSG